MNIFLTGATGFVGGELLVTFSKRKDISKIYCFLRASSMEEAMLKLERIFQLHDDDFDPGKIVPVIGDLFDEDLAQSLISNKIISDTNVVIHSAANTSFSKIFNDVVEKVNIQGLLKILLWAKQLPQFETFLYIGTATICGNDIKHRIVYENESPDIHAKHLVKYTYTKMQGELLLRQHLPGEKILIVRPSIIMGDSRPVVPRSPVILWAVATINLLRLVPVNGNASLDMIPVDYAAEAIANLLFTKRRYDVYHISSGKNAATSAHLLSLSLDNHFKNKPGFYFPDRSLINQVKQWAKNRLAQECELFAYREYLDYWNKIFTHPGELRILLAGLEPYLEFMNLGQVFDNKRLLEDVPSIQQSPPAHVYINNSMTFIEKIDVMEGALNP
jgi:thioester reductase-like protein